jgi:hypothetical protein
LIAPRLGHEQLKDARLADGPIHHLQRRASIAHDPLAGDKQSGRNQSEAAVAISRCAHRLNE